MNTAAKVTGWSLVGLAVAALVVEALSSWVSVQVLRALEENEQ